MRTNITLTESTYSKTICILKSNITLDLNGKTLTGFGGTDAIRITTEFEDSAATENITIQDSLGGGTINGVISIKNNCSLTLKSGRINKLNNYGTLYADGDIIDSDVLIESGTITQSPETAGTVFNGNISVYIGTISGGIFNGEVGNGGAPESSSNISNGIFYGKVTNSLGGSITGGEFHGVVSNISNISGDNMK